MWRLLTYILSPCSRVVLDKLTGYQLVKKSPAFYRTRRFITAFTIPRHLSLSWASWIHPIRPHIPLPEGSNLILSFHLRLGLPSDLFPSGFPTKPLYTPLLSPIRTTCLAHVMIWRLRWHYAGGLILYFGAFLRRNVAVRMISPYLLYNSTAHSLFTCFLHFEVSFTDCSDTSANEWPC